MPNKNLNEELFDAVLRRAFTEVNEKELKKLPTDEELDREITISKKLNKSIAKLIRRSRYEEETTSEMFTEEEQEATETRRKKKGRYVPLKIAAAFLAVLFSIQIISVAALNKNFLESAYNWTKNMFSELIGNTESYDNSDASASGAKIYANVEEFEKTEKINIIVPTYFPNGAKIEKVAYFNDSLFKRVNIFYNDDISLIIDLNIDIINDNITKDSQKYIFNKIDFYVFEDSNTIIWEFEGNYYELTYEFTSDEYKKIIENIK